MKTYCKYLLSLVGEKKSISDYTCIMILSLPTIQTFILSSSISYSLSGRKTDTVCSYLINIHPEMYTSLGLCYSDGNLLADLKKLGSIASLSVFRAAQV